MYAAPQGGTNIYIDNPPPVGYKHDEYKRRLSSVGRATDL